MSKLRSLIVFDMNWWKKQDLITLFIGVSEIAVIAFGVYYIRTFVVPKKNKEKESQDDNKNDKK